MNEPYTILDAMREEMELLDEFIKYYDKLKDDDKGLGLRDMCLQDAWKSQKNSISRILDRFENGKEYYLGVVNGKTKVQTRQTDKHLLREYPALQAAKENYDTVKNIVK